MPSPPLRPAARGPFRAAPRARPRARAAALLVPLCVSLASSAAAAPRQTPSGATSASASAPARTARAGDTLRLALVVDDTSADARRATIDGARLGVEEAARTARLFGHDVTLRILARSDTAAARRAADSVLADGVTALVAACGPELCARLAAIAASREALVVNVSSGDDRLRGDRCAPALFHVAPSDRMRADARRLLDDDDADIAAWLPTLDRYGAAQLRERHREATGREMDERAWAAWLAVKILGEAALRARSTDGARLRAHLVSDRAQFDGHKGAPLSFRPWDRQLRQPLHAPAASDANHGPDGGARTVPQRRPGETLDARALLDRVGATAETTTCTAPR